MEHPLITQVNKHGYVNEEQQYEASETIDMSHMEEIESHGNAVKNAYDAGVLGRELYSGEVQISTEIFADLVSEFNLEVRVRDRSNGRYPIKLLFEYNGIDYITVCDSEEFTGKADRETTEKRK